MARRGVGPLLGKDFLPSTTASLAASPTPTLSFAWSAAGGTVVVAAEVKLLGSVAKSTESIGFLSTGRRRAVVDGLAVMETVEADILEGKI